jgi:SAM-dependent methyltransferase
VLIHVSTWVDSLIASILSRHGSAWGVPPQGRKPGAVTERPAAKLCYSTAVRILETRFLNDGKGFNHGQAAHLIAIDQPDDFRELLENIRKTDYYDRFYFETHSGLRPRSKVPHFWFIAQLLLDLGAGSALDVGCGRGDVLWFLARRGCRVTGVDFSQDPSGLAWPELRQDLRLGDIREQCELLSDENRSFDTIIGLDVWEHLLPASLSDYIASVSRLARRDSIWFVIIPAFGSDRVFGELFPLEFEENRGAFEQRKPFTHLLVEKLDPPIPAQGHLIWAHSEWWEERFSEQGWVRSLGVERAIHSVFDDLLPPSTRAFYVLERRNEAASRLQRAADRWKASTYRAQLLFKLARDLAFGEISLTGEAPRLLDKFVGRAIPGRL